MDSIAGGGGLITLPVLLGVGLPPQTALGTNKLQASFGSGSAMLTFIRAKTVCASECGRGIICTALGSICGSFAIQSLDPGILRLAIPWLLLLIALYTMLTPYFGSSDMHPRFSPDFFYVPAGLILGFYDGFFGPGTGSFWVFALMLGLGLNLTKATGYTKVMNFTSNFASLLVFTHGGHVLWREGLVMGAGQFVGAKIGATMVVTKGSGFIRPLFIGMVFLITAKLIWNNYH